jgi:hypothetical protein
MSNISQIIDNAIPLTKEEIYSLANSIVIKVMDGDLNGLETHIKAKAIVQTFQKVADETQGYAIDEAEKYGKEGKVLGVNFKMSSTGDRFDYEADPEYASLKEALKKREDLLKLAAKNALQMTDEETGEVIPKVPLKTPSKTTLTVTIK